MREDDDKTRIIRGRTDDEALTRVLPGSRGPATADDDADRTRILSQVPGGVAKPAVVVASPGKPGERIVFQCPNGHRIVVGKQFAGKRGKCNKCGADVQIPLASGTASSSSPFETIGPPPEDQDEEDDSSSDDSEAPSLDALAFGDFAGKSPAPVEEFGGIGIDGEAEESKVEDDGAGWNFEARSAPAAPESSAWSTASHAPSFDGDEGNPTARLVARLWHEREHGGIVELHLEGGAVLLPEWYESRWSKGTHGLFASQAPDGSITLTAVAWESVQKVVVRQLAAVPDDMFT